MKKNRILSLITCLLVCFTVMLSGFTSHAADYTMYMPHEQPQVDDSSGYLNYLYRYEADGNTYMYTFYWVMSVVGETGDANSFVDIEFDANGKLWFRGFSSSDATSGGTWCNFTLVRLSPEGIFNVMDSFQFYGSFDWKLYNLDLSFNLTPLNYKVYGNFGKVTTPFGYAPGNTFEVVWGGDVPTIKRLNDILTNVSQSRYLMEQYLPYLQSIYGKTDEVEGLLKDLLKSTQADVDKMEEFDISSSSQAGNLNDLNQQAQVNKPNVEDMSQTVDDNLNIDIDSNYGLLLSTFTSNKQVLTMMLIAVSVALISYVLYGKR